MEMVVQALVVEVAAHLLLGPMAQTQVRPITMAEMAVLEPHHQFLGLQLLMLVVVVQEDLELEQMEVAAQAVAGQVSTVVDLQQQAQLIPAAVAVVVGKDLLAQQAALVLSY